MKYFYLAPYMNDEKSKAELWSFAAALLPFVAHYNPTAAATLRENSDITNKERYIYIYMYIYTEVYTYIFMYI
jgi:hypothetical protein